MAELLKPTTSACASQEILNSLDRCISLSRTLESMSFRIHLGEPAKEISKVKEDNPAPDAFSCSALNKISILSETLSTAIKNLEEFIIVK